VKTSLYRSFTFYLLVTSYNVHFVIRYERRLGQDPLAGRDSKVVEEDTDRNESDEIFYS